VKLATLVSWPPILAGNIFIDLANSYDIIRLSVRK